MPEATLSPYDPTLRDRLRWGLEGLLSSIGASRSTAQRYGDQLVGSPSSHGIAAADVVPWVSNAIAADEAKRSYDRRDYLGAGLGAIAALPPLPMPKGMPQMLGDLADRAAPLSDDAARAAGVPGFTAYHGSPHKFDRFDLSKIGTGEGAQAYGHGLYFADSEDVARSYRDELSPRVPLYKGSKITPESINTGNDLQDAILRDLVASKELDPYVSADRIYNMGRSGRGPRVDWSELRAARDDLAKDVSRASEGGSMYQVRINADPESFLDWDKPLSGQPQLVQDLARNADLSHLKPGNRTRRMIEMWRDGTLANPIDEPTGNVLHSALTDYGTNVQSNAALSDTLRQAGIPGIKYLDQGSRGVGQGSRNYVVFEDSLVDILKRYGLAGTMLGGGAALGLPMWQDRQK